MSGVHKVKIKHNDGLVSDNNPLPTTFFHSHQPVTAQNPLPTDGDSVYSKDIWEDECVTTDWVDYDSTGEDICHIPFNNLHSHIQNSTSDNPKTILVHFQRTINAHQVGIGCFDDTVGNFSNVVIKLLGSGGEVRTLVDDSSNNTKYNSKNYPFEPDLFNAIQLEFHTTDTITLSNITIQKSINVDSFISVQKPDGTIVNTQGTNQGNFKISLEEFENAISTNSNTQLKTTIYDEGGIPASVDDATESLQIVDYNHHEIHSGNYYMNSNVVDLSKNNVIDIRITTPDTTKWSHFAFRLESENETRWYLYEDGVIITAGTQMNLHNNNRNSVNTSGMTIDYIDNSTLTNANADTDISGATQLLTGIIGSRKNAGAAARDVEIILKQNSVYVLRIIANAAGFVDYSFNWYEHTNKN